MEVIQNFLIIDSIKAAWNKVKGSKKTFWAVLIILILLQAVFFVFIEITTLKEVTGFIILITVLFKFFITGIQFLLTWGAQYIGIQRALGEPIQFRMVRHVFTFDLILKMIGLYILKFIVILPVGLLIFLPNVFLIQVPEDTKKIILALCYVVSFILVCYLFLRMYVAKLIVINEKLNPWQAIKISFKVTRSQTWKLFLFVLINVAILIVSAIPLGIGLIWTLPYVYIADGVVYKTLRMPLFNMSTN